METREYIKTLESDIQRLNCKAKTEKDVYKAFDVTHQLIMRKLLKKHLELRADSNGIERRSFLVSAASITSSRSNASKDSGHILIGKPIVYSKRANMGAFDEIIEQGALNATDLSDVAFLVNHNGKMIPLARSRKNNKYNTMHLNLDSEGLTVRIDLDTENNSTARSLYSAVKRGDITGMSFAFVVDSDSWSNVDSEHPTRHILSIRKVAEVSAVTFPAYPQTSIQAK